MKTKDLIMKVERMSQKHPNYNGHNLMTVDVVNNMIVIVVEDCFQFESGMTEDFPEWLHETAEMLN